MQHSYSFSSQEVNYLQNKDFLLTKVRVIKKITLLLSDIQQYVKSYLIEKELDFPNETDLNSGKISKGERYQDLPYVILDFPKLIHRERVFALRTMFWWGNELSCTLHLQGEVWEDLREAFRQNYSQLLHKKVFFCVGENPWEYHFEPDNYLPIDQIPKDQLETKISEKYFLKISRKANLDKPESWKDFVLESLVLYLSTIYP